VGIAIAVETAVINDHGIQVECTMSEYISKELVSMNVTLFHPSESHFTKQTMTIKRGSLIFFSGALSIVDGKLYLELQNFSFVRNNNQTSTPPVPSTNPMP